MAHEVETMAYHHETPWHGLGTYVAGDATPAEMVRHAGLDWTVSKRNLTFLSRNHQDQLEGKNPPAEYIGTRAVEGQYALVRDTDDAFFSIVGSKWQPLQNARAFEFFDGFCTAGGARMETAGSLRGGKLVWGLADLRTDHAVTRSDRIRSYLLLVSPHIGGRAIMARVTPIRVVCANTLALALSGEAKFERRFSHFQEFDPDEAALAVGVARDQVADFAKAARQLRALRMSREEVVRLLVPVYNPDMDPEQVVQLPDTMRDSLRDVMEAYQSAPGASPGNGWGVLNAVTYHADHVAGRRRDTEDETARARASDDLQVDRGARLESAWLGAGAQRKQRVLDDLMALV